MPDNKYNELSDKGWSEMSAVLDKEMPVKNKKRWTFLLFLILGVGLCSLGLVFVWNNSPSFMANSTKNTNTQSSALVTENTANVTVVNSRDEEINISNTHEITEVSDNKRNVVDGLTIVSRTQDEVNVVKTSPNDANDRSNDHKRKLETATSKENIFSNSDLELKNEAAIASASSFSSDAQLETAAKVVGPAKVQVNGGRQHELIEPLMSRGILSGYQTNNDLFYDEFSSYSLVKPTGNKPIYLNLYAGYVFPFNSRIRGPFAGANLEKAFQHRWAISLGIGILQGGKGTGILEARSEEFLDSDPSNTPTEISTQDPGEYSYFSEDQKVAEAYYDLISSKLRKSLYVNVPMTLRYKLSLKHEVGAGVTYSYLLSAINENISLAELENSLAVNNGFLGSRVLSEAGVLTKHNFSLNGHYRFALNAHLGLTAQANYGLNQVIKTEATGDRKNKLTYIGIGIEYRLKM